MKTLTLLLSLLCITSFTKAQDYDKYQKLINVAWDLYEQGNYSGSAKGYSQAFESIGWTGTSYDRYNAACSWALCGGQDSSLFQLEYISNEMEYSNYDHISTDSDLSSLHETKEWKNLLTDIKARKDFIEKDYDKELMASLKALVEKDQLYRKLSGKYHRGEIDTLKYDIDEIYSNMVATDSLNYYTLKGYFEEHGFLGFDKIGVNGSHNFWLLMQHQDRRPEFQREVLKLMKIEMEKDNASNSDYAYLLDRVQVNSDQPQTYGTQMTLTEDKSSYTPKTVIDPDKLNERRVSVQLGTIEDYIKTMNDNYLPKK